VTFIRSWSAAGPRSWCWTLATVSANAHTANSVYLGKFGYTHIWLTSNKLAFSRVQLWLSTWLRSLYCSGIENPAKGTIFAPRSTWRSYSWVRFSSTPDAVAVDAFLAAFCWTGTLRSGRTTGGQTPLEGSCRRARELSGEPLAATEKDLGYVDLSPRNFTPLLRDFMALPVIFLEETALLRQWTWRSRSRMGCGGGHRGVDNGKVTWR